MFSQGAGLLVRPLVFQTGIAQKRRLSLTHSDLLELSIVVPVYNESETLPALLASLAAQRQVRFELLVCDGGSGDGTPDVLRGAEVSFPCRLIVSDKGRGRQLNAGAGAARASLLLFLHADSAFPDPLAFRKGLNALAASGCDVAGHFALRFAGEDGALAAGYYFYECKACLHRPGCTHGDQGVLIDRHLFETVGPFDEDLGFLEDTRLADRIHAQGSWLLLPAEIVTSPRRLQAEGLYPRQLLNALIMNFAAIGWMEILAQLPALYRSQDRASYLRLLPFFQEIRRRLKPLPLLRRWRLWYLTGRYVRQNAWQLAFALDVRARRRRGLAAGCEPAPRLARFDRWWDRLTDHPPGRAAAALLVWLWFHGYLLILERRESIAC